MNSKSLPRLAFTLIELLVVIAIMAILAALMFPALVGLQNTANGTKCASNLKQIGAAMQAFAGEHNGCFPESGGSIAYTNTTGQLAWTKQLEKYLGTFATTTSTNVAIFTCPSISKILSTTNPFSYFNGAFAADPNDSTGFAPVRQALIQYPSKYILAGDMVGGPLTAQDADKDNYAPDPTFDPVNCLPRMPKIHNGKANILFADGHVAGFSTFDYSKTPGTAGTDSDTRSMTVWYDRVADYNGNQ